MLAAHMLAAHMQAGLAVLLGDHSPSFPGYVPPAQPARATCHGKACSDAER